MDENLKSLALTCLNNPGDKSKLVSLEENVAQEVSLELSKALSGFRDSGMTEYGYTLGDYEVLSPQWHVLRIVEDGTLCRFAVDSAAKVVGGVPSDFAMKQASKLLELTTTSLSSSAFAELAESVDDMQEYLFRIGRELDSSRASGELCSLTPDKLATEYRRIVAFELSVLAGRLRTLNNRESKLKIIDNVLLLFLERGDKDEKSARLWQINTLTGYLL